MQLKWPNDVLVDGRKLAGILCEARGTPERWSAVVGIGLNLKSPEPAWPDDLAAIALDELTDDDVRREDLAHALVERLSYWASIVEDEGLAPILKAWMDQGTPIGTPLMRNGVRGTFAGLDSDGALRLSTASGIEVVHAGDVTLADKMEN